MEFEIKYLGDEEKCAPNFATPGSSGADLKANLDEPLVIMPKATVLIGTGVAIFINDPSYGGFLFGRSGLSKEGLVIKNGCGIIDSDYQDEVLAMIYNKSDNPYTMSPYEKVEEFSAITERNKGGFGSTGKK